MPGVPSNLQFSYTLTGRGPVLSGDVQMDESTLADATIAQGTTGSFRIGDGAPAYAAKGHVANLDLQKIGHGFNIPALDAPKYQSRINGDFDVKGSGGGRYPLTLDATGTLVDSEIFRATMPRFEFTTNFAGGDAHVVANGRVHRPRSGGDLRRHARCRAASNGDGRCRRRRCAATRAA